MGIAGSLDFIQEVNRNPVRNVAGNGQILAEIHDQSILFLVRGGQTSRLR